MVVHDELEWTKLRTVAGTFWLLAAATRCPAGLPCPVDTARLTLTGVQLGQALIATLAVRVISSEYRTGMIRTTLTAIPRRPTMLAVKATILTGPMLATGAKLFEFCF
jgi:ABC-2 type transport system permease protein